MSVTQSPLPEEPQRFGIGEIVWAKVRGFPWWPAKIGEQSEYKGTGELKFTVYFIGDATHCVLQERYLRNF
jgi:hypothetical protein